MSSLEKIPEIDQLEDLEDEEPETEKEKAPNPPTGRDMGRVTDRDKGAVSKKPGTKFDPSLMIINEHKRNKMVVAAIDFGTAYSGYAYSLKHDFEIKPLRIMTNHWTVKGSGSMSLKAPTSILLNPDQKFHAFGYEADQRYTELAQKGLGSEWYYFQKFKMKLQGNMDVTRKRMLEDIEGKQVPAHTIFAMSINFLKMEILKSLTKHSGYTIEDVHFIITIPAVWTDAAKQFMREAALEAGIPGDNLSLAYESEVAAVYCRHLPKKMLVGLRGRDLLQSFNKGRKFMVLDLGGGTCDISVMEVVNDGNIEHIRKATGGAWGGGKVNEEFSVFLNKIFGEDVVTQCWAENPSEYLEMVRAFEIKKRKICKETTDEVPFKIPAELRMLLKLKTGFELEEVIRETKYNGKVIVKGDKILIDPNVFREFFKKTIDSIIKHMKEIFEENSGRHIATILLVGGFTESPLVREAVREAFPNMMIITPKEPSMAVLKGAVLFGQNPECICSRICKSTYGIRIARPFIDGIHRDEYKVLVDGKYYCKNLFQVFFAVDQKTKIGETFRYPIHNSYESEIRQDLRKEPKITEIYISDDPHPLYITDSNCKKHGEIIMEPPGGLWPEKFSGFVEMEIAGTEIVGRFVNKQNGETNMIYLDFLS